METGVGFGVIAYWQVKSGFKEYWKEHVVEASSGDTSDKDISTWDFVVYKQERKRYRKRGSKVTLNVFVVWDVLCSMH